jgi:hypothetical protein
LCSVCIRLQSDMNLSVVNLWKKQRRQWTFWPWWTTFFECSVIFGNLRNHLWWQFSGYVAVFIDMFCYWTISLLVCKTCWQLSFRPIIWSEQEHWITTCPKLCAKRLGLNTPHIWFIQAHTDYQKGKLWLWCLNLQIK